MFCSVDEDDSPKTPIVHPNDVLDIEVSPIARPFVLPPPPGYEYVHSGSSSGMSFQKPACSTSKHKLKKLTRSNSSAGATKRHSVSSNSSSSVKRGDPFLPSVFSDENPIADFTVKKNSRKKPSDCKCKGFGYNLSPSALLPEEMRQQWGVGVFGKQATIKPAISSSSNMGSVQLAPTPVGPPTDREFGQRCSISTMPRLASIGMGNNMGGTYSTSSFYNLSGTINNCGNINTNSGINNNLGVYCSLRCMRCMREPCICADLSQIHEGFRIPDHSERRKHKISSKGLGVRGKENKLSNGGVISNTITTTPVKRTACFSSKENSNIISTSNFPRNSSSPVPINHTSFMYNSETMGMGSSSSVNKTSSMSKLCHLPFDPHIGTKSGAFYNGEHSGYNRHNVPVSMPRRALANISPAPIISTGIMDTGTAYQNSQISKKAAMIPRGSSIPSSRRASFPECACDSCRRRPNVMSTMEALSLPTGETNQHGLSPYMMTRSQLFPPPRAHTLPVPSRYSPYRLPSYSFKSSLRDVYGSPETFTRSGSPVYDYGEPTGLGPSSFSGASFGESQELNRLDSSTPLYLETDSAPASPPIGIQSGSGWGVDDITDLSIKETVEFFVSLKPPISASVPSPQSDTSSDMFSPSPGEHRCTSPGLGPGSGSCFCMGPGALRCWPNQPVTERPYGRDSLGTFDEPISMKFTATSTPVPATEGSSVSGTYPPRMVYSSLVSDLEDELRSAIENIPTG